MEEKKTDDYTVASSYAGSDDGTIEDSEEAIAKRLREKIRSQAEDLLSRVDSMRDSHSTTRTCPNSMASSAASPRGLSSAASTSTSSESLTKRLQVLALQRRTANARETNAERLRLVQHEQLAANDGTQHLRSAHTTFDELSLPRFLLDAVYSMGFDRPSAIQAASLPIILAGRNLMGQAQSGSGKTAAFCLGMLYHLDVNIPSPQAICVVPTRELAIQIVQQTILPMSQYMDQSLFSVQLAISQQALVSSSSSSPSSDRSTTTTTTTSKKQVTSQIVVGTPGKVVDWLKRKFINGKTVKVLVLDEADAMVETHRANSLLIRKHLNFGNENANGLQCLLFSATFNQATMEFADKFVSSTTSQKHATCDRILIDSEDLVLQVIKQVWIDTRSACISKLEFLADIYSILTIAQSIVFVNTKQNADKVYATLSDSGYTCSVIHSGIEDRDTVMAEFRSGSSNVLISTNVLARGVDVDAVCLVINYDVPIDKDGRGDPETYLHRIGRTGRFGRKGTAINFCDSDEAVSALANIEAFYKQNGQEMIHQVAADPEALAGAIEI